MHDFPIVNSPFTPNVAVIFIPLIFIVLVWTLIIKGYALWCAARRSQKGWFIALLLVNTLGILEIVYLIWFRAAKPDVGEAAPIVSSSVPQ